MPRTTRRQWQQRQRPDSIGAASVSSAVSTEDHLPHEQPQRATRSRPRATLVNADYSLCTDQSAPERPAVRRGRRLRKRATHYGFTDDSTDSMPGKPSDQPTALQKSHFPTKKLRITAFATSDAEQPPTNTHPQLQSQQRSYYKLRATEARGQRYSDLSSSSTRQPGATITTVTPATAMAVPRHLNFDTEADDKYVDCSSTQKATTELPDGVINIFSRNQKLIPFTTTCCSADIARQNDTALASSHIASYGEEYNRILMEKEKHQKLFFQRKTPTLLHRGDDSISSLGYSGGNDANANDCNIRVNRRNKKKMSNKSSSSLFESTQPLPRQPFVTPKMRSILINWMVEVSQEYNVSEDAFHLAVTLLDLMLLRGPTKQQLEDDYDGSDSEDSDEEVCISRSKSKAWFLIRRADFQAIGCVCLSIASKLEDRNPPRLEDMVYISDHSFKCSKLIKLEAEICMELGFRLHRITPIHFINVFLKASHACSYQFCQFDHPVLRQLVYYLLELSRLSYTLSLEKPSRVAAAALYLARATLGIQQSQKNNSGNEKYWTPTLVHYTGHTVEDLKHSVLIIHRYQLLGEGSSHTNASFLKYVKQKYHRVSYKTALRVEDLGFHDLTFGHDDFDFEAGRLMSSGLATF